jgi:hypothetical protein
MIEAITNIAPRKRRISRTKPHVPKTQIARTEPGTLPVNTRIERIMETVAPTPCKKYFIVPTS